MSTVLSQNIKALVSALQQPWIFRVAREVLQLDARSTAAMAKDSLSLHPKAGPEDILREMRRCILSKIVSNEQQVDFIVKIPEWLGFKAAQSLSNVTRETMVRLSVMSAASTFWLLTLAKTALEASSTPRELRDRGFDAIVRSLVESDASRDQLVNLMRAEMVRRGMDADIFEVRGILSGYDVRNPVIQARTRTLFALTLMTPAGLQIDADCLLKQDLGRLVLNATGHILAAQTMRHVRQQIAGDGRRKPFEWPMVGDKKACDTVLAALDVLTETAKDVTCSTVLPIDSSDPSIPTRAKVVGLFLDELILHYSDLIRNRRGKGDNEDLISFVDLLKGDRTPISKRVAEVRDQVQQLMGELDMLKRKAKAGFVVHVAPEKMYSSALESLEVRLRARARSDDFQTALVDEATPVFNSIVEIVRKNRHALGEDEDRFVEALCFETCFRILESMGFGGSIIDLPWVSRFVADQTARGITSTTTRGTSDPEERCQRIVSAFAGGLIYLILQARQPPKVQAK